MIKKFAEKFEKVSILDLYQGKSEYKLFDKVNDVFSKGGKLYVGFLNTKGKTAEGTKFMIPKDIYDEFDKYFKEQLGKEFKITKFPYMHLRGSTKITCDAFIEENTFEIRHMSSPALGVTYEAYHAFSKRVSFGETPEEGFAEIEENLLKQLQVVGSEYTVVFKEFPFAEPFMQVEEDSIHSGFSCLTLVAIVKNPIIYREGETATSVEDYNKGYRIIKAIEECKTGISTLLQAQIDITNNILENKFNLPLSVKVEE